MWKILIICGIALLSGCSENKDNDWYIPTEYLCKYDMQQRIDIHNAWRKAGGLAVDGLHDSIKYILLVEYKIADIFNKENVDNVYDKSNIADRKKIAFYTVKFGNRQRNFMIYNNGEYTFFLDNSGYEKNIMDILKYFKRHKNIDPRLLPLCIQEITKLEVANRRTLDQYGPWRHWWGEKADSLGQIYNKYLNY